MATGTIMSIIYIIILGILLSILARFIGSKIFRFSEIFKFIQKFFQKSK